MMACTFLAVMAAGLATGQAAALAGAEDYTTTTPYWDTTTTYDYWETTTDPYWDTTTKADSWETTTTTGNWETTTTTAIDPADCPAGWIQAIEGCFLFHYTEVRPSLKHWWNYIAKIEIHCISLSLRCFPVNSTSV
jgi:hypothetical protein